MRTQLEGVHQAWEATNIELRSIGGQLGGISQELEYLAGMAWKRYTVTWGSLASKGVTRQEAAGAGMEAICQGTTCF